MTVIGTAYVDIKGDTSNFEKDTTNTAKNTAVKAAAAFAAAFVIKEAWDFFSGAVKAAETAQQATNQVNQVLKTTGDVARTSAGWIDNFAKSMSLKTGYDYSAIKSSEGLLVTFTNVRNEAGKGNDIFNQASAATLDLARKTGDTSSAAKLLGKALNDPIGGLGALSRVGVQFSAQQKAQIKGFMDQNDIMDAQKIVLGQVETKWGGQATAQATASAKMSAAWGQFKIEVGNALMPLLEKFASDVLPGLMDSAKKLIPVILDMVKKLAPVAEAIGKIVVKGVALFISDLITGFRALTKLWGPLPLVLAGVAAAIWLVNWAMDANPAGIIILAIAALVVGIVELSKHWKQVWGDIKNWFDDAVRFLRSGFGTLVLLITGPIAPLLLLALHWQAVWSSIRAVVNDVWHFLDNDVFQPLKNFFTDSLPHALDTVKSTWDTVWGDIKTTVLNIWNDIWNAINTAVNAVWTAVDTVLIWITNAWNTVWGAIRDFATAVWNAIWGAINTAVNAVWTAIDTVLGWISNAWSTVWNAIKDFAKTVWDAIWGAINTGAQAIWTAITTVLGWIQNAWNTVWNAVSSFVKTAWDTIWGWINTGAQAIWTAVNTVLGWISSTWNTVWQSVSDFVKGIWDTIWGWVNNGIVAVRGTIDTVLGWISSTWGSVWNGLSTGFTSVWDTIKRIATDGVNGVIDVINGIITAIDWVLDKLPGGLHIDTINHVGESAPTFSGPQLGIAQATSSWHSGGVIPWSGSAPIGMKSNERLVQLLVGEEVLTENDPRHAKNLGGGFINNTGSFDIGGILGDIGGFFSSVGHDVLRAFADAVAATATPAIKAGEAAVAAIANPLGWVGKPIKGASQYFGDAILNFISNLGGSANAADAAKQAAASRGGLGPISGPANGTLAQFFSDVLNGIGAPINTATIGDLSEWQRVEGGWTNNPDMFNPWGTTLPAGGSHATNSAGRAGLPDLCRWPCRLHRHDQPVEYGPDQGGAPGQCRPRRLRGCGQLHAVGHPVRQGWDHPSRHLRRREQYWRQRGHHPFDARGSRRPPLPSATGRMQRRSSCSSGTSLSATA